MANRLARRWKLGIAAISTLLLAATPASASTPTVPSGSPAASEWAWVVVRQAAANYTPAALDRGNSHGLVNSVLHDNTGRYSVLMRGMATTGGTVLVTPIGSTLRMCMTGGWGSDGTNTSIEVDCYSRTGIAMDSAFVVNYVRATGTGGQFGYAWENQPGTAAVHPTSATYQYDSRGGTVTGQYTPNVHDENFPNIGTPASGAAFVTAYGGTAAQCSTAGWNGFTSASHPELVQVFCTDPSGFYLNNQEFDVVYLHGLGLKGINRTNVAYLFANHKGATSSYVPPAAYTYVSAGTAPRVRRPGIGKYTVLLPGMPAGGSVQVTASPVRASVCTITSIRLTAPQRVGVRCFRISTGVSVNAAFTLAYTK